MRIVYRFNLNGHVPRTLIKKKKKPSAGLSTSFQSVTMRHSLGFILYNATENKTFLLFQSVSNYLYSELRTL